MKLNSVVGGRSGNSSGKLSVRVSSQRKIAAITANSGRLFGRCYCETIRAETRRHERRILSECLDNNTLVRREGGLWAEALAFTLERGRQHDDTALLGQRHRDLTPAAPPE